MQRHLLKNTVLKKSISNFWNKRKGELIDIIAFGSAVRGKESPADLDLLLLFRDEVHSETVYELRGILERGGFKADVLGKSWNEMLSSDFLARESVLSEGVSLVSRKGLAEGFGYRSFIMFRYDMKGKTNTEVTKFYYALYGRKREGGFLKEVMGLKFT
ncbi:MAG: nucleotidyltransferase domain-containing protein, partial [Candidatus Micrarchaeota archaeon]